MTCFIYCKTRLSLLLAQINFSDLSPWSGLNPDSGFDCGISHDDREAAISIKLASVGFPRDHRA